MAHGTERRTFAPDQAEGGRAGAAGAAPAPPPAPALRPLFVARVEVGSAVELGAGGGGRRRLVPITGGTFAGDRLEGTVLPGGADWQFVRDADGVAEIEARYALRTRDGAAIVVTSSGYRHGPPDVLAALAAGRRVDPAGYYFRTRLTFATGDAGYAWLTRAVAVATGARRPDAVELAAFEVL